MKQTFFIAGMHCASCELLLEKELQKIGGVAKVNASHKKHTVEIESHVEIPETKMKQAVEACGYHLKKDAPAQQNRGKTAREYVDLALVFIFVFGAVYVFTKLDFNRFIPQINSHAGVFVALMVGFVASVSTCLALVGGIVMGFASMYPVRGDKKHKLFHRTIPHVYFHAGRIASFAVLGGVLGLVGSRITYSPKVTAVLSVFVAIVMIYIALQILHLVPNITKLGFHLPKGVQRAIRKLEKNEKPHIPALIGALTFFLPCGFTQSMQLASVASGSFFSGALIMSAFALGTMPVLIGIGIGSTYAQKSSYSLVHKVIGVAVLFFGLFSLNSGIVLAGFHSPVSYFSLNTPSFAQFSGKEQIVKMDIDYAFVPNSFTVRKNVPVRWEINGINISGCSDEIIIPKLGLSTGKLKTGLNVVEFTPTEEGILPFSCWMGMIGGQFMVTDELGKIDKNIERSF